MFKKINKFYSKELAPALHEEYLPSLRIPLRFGIKEWGPSAGGSKLCYYRMAGLDYKYPRSVSVFINKLKSGHV